MNRRGFLRGALALVAAPAVVRASSIMRVAVPAGFQEAAGGFIVPVEFERQIRDALALNLSNALDRMIVQGQAWKLDPPATVMLGCIRNVVATRFADASLQV